MTDEQKKRLTLYLGDPEATSEYTVANNGDLVSVRTVIKDRTFDTDADMMALFRKIVDKGEYDSFYLPLLSSLWHRKGDALFSTWLFYDPERFCCLVAQWLEEGKK